MSLQRSQALLAHARRWHIVDCTRQPVGRIAQQCVSVLTGRYKPIWHPTVDIGDHIVVVNSDFITLTGRKWDHKLYRHHTGHPGGLKEEVAKRMHDRDQTMVLKWAVRKMLPKTKFRPLMMERMHVFPLEEHPYAENINSVLQPPNPLRELDDLDGKYYRPNNIATLQWCHEVVDTISGLK